MCSCPTTSENTLGRHLRYSAWYMDLLLPKKQKFSSVGSCGAGALTAHGWSLLMLLGSPPDMIRGYPLRETGSAAVSGGEVVVTILLQLFPLGNRKI